MVKFSLMVWVVRLGRKLAERNREDRLQCRRLRLKTWQEWRDAKRPATSNQRPAKQDQNSVIGLVSTVATNLSWGANRATGDCVLVACSDGLHFLHAPIACVLVADSDELHFQGEFFAPCNLAKSATQDANNAAIAKANAEDSARLESARMAFAARNLAEAHRAELGDMFSAIPSRAPDRCSRRREDTELFDSRLSDGMTKAQYQQLKDIFGFVEHDGKQLFLIDHLRKYLKGFDQNSSYWDEVIGEVWLMQRERETRNAMRLANNEESRGAYSYGALSGIARRNGKRKTFGQLAVKVFTLDETDANLLAAVGANDDASQALADVLGKRGLMLAALLGAELTEAIIRCSSLRQAVALASARMNVSSRTLWRKIRAVRLADKMATGIDIGKRTASAV